MFCHSQLINHLIIYLLIIRTQWTIQYGWHSGGQQGSWLAHLQCTACDRVRHGNQKIKRAIGVLSADLRITRIYQMTVCLIQRVYMHGGKASSSWRSILCAIPNTARGRGAVPIERFT